MNQLVPILLKWWFYGYIFVKKEFLDVIHFRWTIVLADQCKLYQCIWLIWFFYQFVYFRFNILYQLVDHFESRSSCMLENTKHGRYSEPHPAKDGKWFLLQRILSCLLYPASSYYLLLNSLVVQWYAQVLSIVETALFFPSKTPSNFHKETWGFWRKIVYVFFKWVIFPVRIIIMRLSN